jgi:hypothetical protein
VDRDKPRPVALEPPEVVFGTLEALVGDIRSRRKWPTLKSLGFAEALRAKKVSAACWSVLEAAEKQKPVITPYGLTAASKRKPSYHPKLLDHPMSA